MVRAVLHDHSIKRVSFNKKMFDLPGRHTRSLIFDSGCSDVAVNDKRTSRTQRSRGSDRPLENQQISSALGRSGKAPNPKSCLSKDGGPVGKGRPLSGKSCSYYLLYLLQFDELFLILVMRLEPTISMLQY